MLWGGRDCVRECVRAGVRQLSGNVIAFRNLDNMPSYIVLIFRRRIIKYREQSDR